MDIHKPKPWHGFREFLKEYLIIVVGVLTALGAESVVETVHERRLSAEAREAVRAELNTDITNVSRRIPDEPCILRRLDDIKTLLDKADSGQKFEPAGMVGGTGRESIATQRWQAATSGGRTSLLTSDEQADFARVYNMLGEIQRLESEERPTWQHLRALTGLTHLSQGMIDQQRLALWEARNSDAEVQSDLQQAKFYADRIGIKGDAKLILSPGVGSHTRTNTLCEPWTAEAKR